MEDKNSGHILEKDKEKDLKCKNANIILIRIREPQLPILKSSSICFLCKSTKVISDELIKTINNVINYLNKNFHGKIEFIKNINKTQILENFNIECNYKSIRLYEKNQMNNGQMAKIIKYNGSKNITLQFEDGTIVENKQYSSFQKGCISNPNFTKTVQQKERRLGEKKLMNCGSECKIIEYNTSENITVQFEDKTILKNRTYDQFKKGSIKNPKLKKNSS